jgi:hypothetical protein
MLAELLIEMANVLEALNADETAETEQELIRRIQIIYGTHFERLLFEKMRGLHVSAHAAWKEVLREHVLKGPLDDNDLFI